MKTNLTQTPVSLSVQTVLDESPQAKTVKSTKRMQSSAQTQKHTDTQSRNNALLKKRILGEELLTSLGVTSQETLAAGAEQTLQLAQAATTVSDAPAQSTQPALSTLTENIDANAALPPIEPIAALPSSALPSSAVAAWAPAAGGISVAGLGAGLVGALALGASGGGGPTPTANSSAAPKALTSGLAPDSDSATPGDNVTNVAKPTLKGTAAPGANVLIAIDTNGDGIADVTFSAVANANGEWSATPATALPDGTISAMVSVLDANGNPISSSSVSFVIDTTIAAPAPSLDSNSNSGSLSDNITNNTTPTIVGNGAKAGDKITVALDTDGDGVVDLTLTTIADANGNWSVTPQTPLADGIVNASVMASDAAGNISAPVNLSLTIQTIQASLSPTSDSGLLGDTVTSDNTPSIRGTGTPGTGLRIISPTGEVITTTVAANGTWEITPLQPLPDGGPQNFAVSSVNANGFINPPLLLPVTIDSTSPGSPVAILDPASDSGVLGDRLTNDTTPTISGTGTPGDIINVLSPMGELLTATVDLNGKWSVTPLTALLAGGPQDFIVTTTEPSGNVSAPSKVPVVINTATPTLTAMLDLSSDSGIFGDNKTADTTPTITGTGAAGDTISVISPTGEVLTTTVLANGSWSVTPLNPLPENGPQSFVVTATSPAGNDSTAISVPVTIDTALPAPPIADLAATSDTGLAGDHRTNDSTPTITGTGTPGDTVEVTSPSGEILTALIGANGAWSVTPTILLSAGGPQNFSVTATDPSGNVSLPTIVAVTIDTQATLAPVITITSDANNDAFLNSTELGASSTIAVKIDLPAGAVAGDIVTITDGATIQTITLDSAQIGANAVLAIVARPANGESLNVVASLTDLAGNTSASSSDRALIDTTAPGALTVSINTDLNNDGTINATELGTVSTVQISIDLPANAAVGDTITVTDTAGNSQDIVITAAMISTTSVSVAFPAPAEDATITITASLSDPAGNSSPTATDAAIRDTFASSAPTITITNDSNNDGLLNAVELGASTQIPLIVGLPSGLVAGDLLELSSSAGLTYSFSLTALDISTGTFSTNLPKPAEGGLFTVSAITVHAGNSSPLSSDSVQLDTIALAAPSVEIIEDANNNGFISATELSGLVDVKVTLPAGARIGDTVKVQDNAGNTKLISLTTADIVAGSVTTNFPVPTETATFSVTASVTDLAGNPGAVSTADSAARDTVAPVAPDTVLDPTSDSGVKLDNRTNDTTPTFSGTGNPNDVITVVTPKGEVLTITVASNGTWSITPTIAFDEGGPQNVKVTATDPAGNVSPEALVPIIIDVTAPSNLVADVASSSDSGLLGDYRTNDATPTISGTGTPGDTIKVASPTGEILNTTIALDGTWSVTPVTALPEGSSQNFIVTATDAAGNESSAVLVPVTIDTTPPALTADLASSSDSGALSDHITSDNTPTISGTGDAGDKITVLSPTGEVLTTVVNGSGTWRVTPTVLLPDGGPQIFKATATDAAGNVSPIASVPVTVDTTTTAAPPAVTITADLDNNGFLNAAELGIAATVLVKITLPTGAAEGDQITVTDGTTPITLTLTAANLVAGFISSSVARPAEGTDLNVSASLTDIAGNTSPSATDSAQIDTTAPSAPTITIDTDTNNDGFINATEMGIETTVAVTIGLPANAAAGDTLAVTDNAGNTRSFVLTSAMITAREVITSFPLPAEDQTMTVQAKLTDVAGNSSALASDSAIRDTFAPGSPVVTIAGDADNNGYISAAEAGSSSTVAVTIGLPTDPAFTARAGDTLKIADNYGNVQTVTLTAANIAAGTVALTVPLPPEAGILKVTALLTDPAQNSSPSAFDIAKLDTVGQAASSVQIVEDSNNNGYISATELSGQVDVKVTLPAGASVGETVKVLDNLGNVRSMTLTAADITAGFVVTSFAPPAQGATISVTASIIDLAGNPGTVSAADTAVLDTVAPVAPIAVLDPSSDSGLAGDLRTNNKTPTISGTGAPGNTIQVVSPTGEILTATVAGNGTWSVTPITNLTEGGPQNFTVTSTNSAGNVGPSTVLAVTIDTVAPALTADVAASSDSGTLGDHRTNDNTPTISGTGEVGATVKVVSPTGEIITTVVAANGTWSVTPNTALPNGGPQNFAVSATDAAGNITTAFAVPITIDTSAPAAVADTASGTEDSASVTGNAKANDTNLDGSEVYSLLGSNLGTYGSLVLNSDASYTYTRSASADTILLNTHEVFTYKATDSAGNSTTSTIDITLTPVNDAPTITANTIAIAVNEHAAINLSNKGLTFGDVDASSGQLTLTLTSANAGDSITIASGTSGVTVVSGNGSNAVVIDGTLAQINALMASTGAQGSVSYQHNLTAAAAEGIAATTITALISDQGNTGSGGVLTASYVIPVTINALAETIRATPGNDTVFSGLSNDTIKGSSGDDQLYGGAGDDLLMGGTAYLSNSSFEHWTARTVNFGGSYPNWYQINSLPHWTIGGTGSVELDCYAATTSDNTLRNTANSQDGRYAIDVVPNGFSQLADTTAGALHHLEFELTDKSYAGAGPIVLVQIDGVTVASITSAGVMTLSGTASNGAVAVDGIAGISAYGNDRKYSFDFVAGASGTSNIKFISSAAAANDGRALDDVRLTSVLADGNDTLNGGSGNDSLFGMLGNNTLTGGSGADRFVVSRYFSGTNDTITDFQVGTDKLVLCDLFDLTSSATSNPGTVADSSSLLDANDLISSGGTNQTASWNDATHTLTMGWGATITFQGLTTSYANAAQFLAANAVLTMESFGPGV